MTVFKRNIPAPPQMGPVLGHSSYIDDIAHGAATWDQLCDDLDALLYRLRYWNISISLPKNEFGKRTISRDRCRRNSGYSEDCQRDSGPTVPEDCERGPIVSREPELLPQVHRRFTGGRCCPEDRVHPDVEAPRPDEAICDYPACQPVGGLRRPRSGVRRSDPACTIHGARPERCRSLLSYRGKGSSGSNSGAPSVPDSGRRMPSDRVYPLLGSEVGDQVGDCEWPHGAVRRHAFSLRSRYPEGTA
ncbi:hypothetical protein ON010_g12130 [Phytophthora cinnamomi]|nr:hypothetical protein ON010_g12130 [Phytophthora cinnamomi]